MATLLCSPRVAWITLSKRGHHESDKNPTHLSAFEAEEDDGDGLVSLVLSEESVYPTLAALFLGQVRSLLKSDCDSAWVVPSLAMRLSRARATNPAEKRTRKEATAFIHGLPSVRLTSKPTTDKSKEVLLQGCGKQTSN